MCGINGIIFKTSKTDVSKILKMNALLDHRGPDDNNFRILSVLKNQKILGGMLLFFGKVMLRFVYQRLD